MRTVTVVRRTLTRRRGPARPSLQSRTVAAAALRRFDAKNLPTHVCNAGARPAGAFRRRYIVLYVRVGHRLPRSISAAIIRSPALRSRMETAKLSVLSTLKLCTYSPSFDSFQATRPIIPLPVLRPLTPVRPPVRCGKPSDGDLGPPASSRALSLWFMSIQLSTTSIQQIQPIFNREEELRVLRSYYTSLPRKMPPSSSSLVHPARASRSFSQKSSKRGISFERTNGTLPLLSSLIVGALM